VPFPQLLLDTDILSAMMRNNLLVRAKGQSYLDRHGRFTFSIITRYEILRGLKVRQALKQTVFFDKFCSRCTILPITDKVVMVASDIYADLHRRGELIGDADILIAASALVNGFGLVTNNVHHYGRIKELMVENWLSS
jgi:tRNA(fMet)-specific endonuclease VapC